MFGLFGGKDRRIKQLESELDWEQRRSAAGESIAKSWENDYRRVVREKDALIETLNTRTEDVNKGQDRIAVLDDALAEMEKTYVSAYGEWLCSDYGVQDQTRLKEKAWWMLQDAHINLIQRKNQVGELGGDIALLKRDIGEKDRLIESNGDIIKLQSGRITELEKERDDLLGRLDLAKADIDAKDATIVALREYRDDLLAGFMRDKTDLHSYAVKLFGFWQIDQQICHDQRLLIDGKDADLDRVIQQRGDAITARDEAKASLEEAQKEFRQQAAQINTQTGLNRDEMNRLKRELTEKDERIGTLEAELESRNERPYARLRNDKGQFMSREEIAARSDDQSDNPSDCN